MFKANREELKVSIKWKQIVTAIVIAAIVVGVVLLVFYDHNHPACSSFNSMGFTKQQQVVHFLKVCNPNE